MILQNPDDFGPIYLAALGGAVLGALTGFLIVVALPDHGKDAWDYDDEDDDFRGRRRRRRYDDDDYDDEVDDRRTRRRRDLDDDLDEDRPRRRRDDDDADQGRYRAR